MHTQRIIVSITAMVIVLLTSSVNFNNVRAQCQAQELVELLASDAYSDDSLGYSVDINGDVAVVGAYQEGELRGAVYVYRYDGSGWIEEAKLIASDAAFADQFGWSVAMSGDTIVVGAHFVDVGQWSNAGAAYVFVYDGSGWRQAAKLTAARPFVEDKFGHAVDIDGDRIIVGAHHDDDSGSNSGQAYFFQKPPSGWADMTQTAKLTAADTGDADEYGVSVSISGDVAVVGAHMEDAGGIVDSGAVYIFQFNGSAWTQVAKLSVSDVLTQDRLGISVAIDGDVVVAGAWGKDDAGDLSGAAYVYEKPATGWTDMTETAKLTASDAIAGDRFGWWVSIDGDDIVIGAPAHKTGGFNFGSAYAFKRPSGGWSDMTENARFTGSDEEENDGFAIAVSVGSSRAIVGSYIHTHFGSHGAGAAYIFGSLSDCQPNGTMDVCDIALGSSADSNGNGVPDECEAAAASIEGSLTAYKAEASQITLSWIASCLFSDIDYEIYEGSLGDFTSHTARFCTTGGELEKTFLPAEGDTYYLVVTRNFAYEGSYGLETGDVERFRPEDACLPRLIADCP